MNDKCLTCKDSGTIGSDYCTCRIGHALREASEKVQEKRETIPSISTNKDVQYWQDFADRASLKAHGMTFQQLQEKKVKELLQAMKAGRVTTRMVFHEKDRRKLSERFGLWDSEDFLPVLVPADEFRKYYPKYEGNGKVRAYRLNPHKYGPPGPEVEPKELDLFTQPTQPKTRKTS